MNIKTLNTIFANKYICENYSLFCLTILYILVISYLGIWIYSDNTPLSYDQSAYMTVMYQIGYKLKAFDLFGAIKIFIHHEAWEQRPGLVMFVGGVVNLIVGNAPKLILFILNSMWLILLTVYTYKISIQLSNNRVISILSVFMTLTCPIISVLSRDNLLDLPLTSMFIVFVYYTIKTDLFESGIIKFIISFILVSLTKESFFLYGFSFLGVILIYLLYSNIENKWKRIRHLFIGLFIGVLVLLFFYAPIIRNTYQNIINNIGSEVGHYYGRSSNELQLKFYFYYIFIIISAVSFLYIVLPIFAFIFSFLVKVKARNYIRGNTLTLLIIYSVFVIYIFLTFIQDSDIRFVAPITPLICILSSIVIYSSPRLIKFVLMIMVFSFGTVQFYAQLFSINYLPESYNISINSLGSVDLFRQYKSPYYSCMKFGLPNQANWLLIHEIFSDLQNNDLKTVDLIGIIGSTCYFNNNIMQMELAGSNLKISNSIDIVNDQFDAPLSNFKFILVKMDNTCDDPFCKGEYKFMNKYYTRINQLNQIKSFKVIRKYKDPNSDNIFLYENIMSK